MTAKGTTGSLARSLGIPERAYPADWRKGNRAGIDRNLEMLDTRPDLVIAFWDGLSTGTKHTIDEARKRGIEVEVHTQDSASAGLQDPAVVDEVGRG